MQMEFYENIVFKSFYKQLKWPTLHIGLNMFY